MENDRKKACSFRRKSRRQHILTVEALSGTANKEKQE